VSRRLLRLAGGGVVVLAFVALVLSLGPLGDTLALFNGETQNAGSTFAGGWVGAPTGASATASGYDVNLAWTPGTHGPVTGQQLLGVDNSTNSDCTGAAYALIATLASATTASYTDLLRGTALNDGNWFCYELVSTSASVWTAATPLPAIQVGLAATGLSIANAGGTAGTIERNDTIKLTFNQQTNLGTSNINVCVWSSGVIVLGDTLACLTSTDPYTVGKLTLSGATIAGNLAFTSSTVALSGSAPWTMTITLRSTTSTTTVTGSPTWTLTPAATILSAVSTHQATICTTATSTCQPTTTGNF
jgi:hypothetical protein